MHVEIVNDMHSGHTSIQEWVGAKRREDKRRQYDGRSQGTSPAYRAGMRSNIASLVFALLSACAVEPEAIVLDAPAGKADGDSKCDF